MTLFRCFARGENFPSIRGTEKLQGFYTTRFVEAPSAEEAELEALGMLREEYQFTEEQKLLAPEPKVYFEEVVEVSPDTPRVPNRGATWFDMDD